MLKKCIAGFGIAAGVVAIVLFFVVEDLGAGMVLVNGWTPVFLALAAGSGGALVYVWRGKKK